MLTASTSAAARAPAEIIVTPGSSIQAAINSSQNGDSIRIQTGTYEEQIDFGDKQIRIYGEPHVILDGFDYFIPGTLPPGSMVTFSGTNVPNQILEGIEIREGFTLADGGGIYIGNTSPIIRDCVITTNFAYRGGGVAIYLGDPTFENCRITFGQARNGTQPGGTSQGGGVFMQFSNAVFIDCQFDSNYCEGYGGAIAIQDSNNPRLENCELFFNRSATGGALSCRNVYDMTLNRVSIRDNLADLVPEFGVPQDNLGGGVYSWQSSLTLDSVQFYSNEAGRPGQSGQGGAFYHWDVGNYSGCVLRNCTIVDNTARNSGLGGGVACKDSQLDIENSIVWDNSTQGGFGDQLAILGFSGFANPALSASYCDLQGGDAAVYVWHPSFYSSNNTMNLDPLFVDPVGSVQVEPNYELLPNSPAIDAGDPSFAPQLGALDLNGDVRLLSLAVDMGMDEFADCAIATNYGPQTINSSGNAAVISMSGSTSIAANDLVLQATGAAPGFVGQFLYGDVQVQVPLGNGNVLVGGSLQRITPLVVVDAQGNSSFTVDYTQAPFDGPNALVAGSSWNFQLWFRDNDGTSTSNLSDGMNIIFCP